MPEKPYQCPVRIVTDPNTGEQTLQLPQAWYPHAIPDAAMYGAAKTLARSIGGPVAFAYVAALTIYAGQGVNTPPGYGVRPTLYSILIAPPEVGKTRTRSRILEAAPGICRDRIQQAAPASANGLIALYEEQLDAFPSTLVVDEMVSMINRLNYEGSSLGQATNELFNDDHLAIADRKNKKECWVRLSILGNLTASDAQEFLELFGAATRTGFYSRFILVPGPQKWRWDDQWVAPGIELPGVRLDPADPLGDQMTAQCLFTAPTIPPSAWEALASWREAGDSRGRLGEICMRVAVISACINGDREITPACMQAALAFGEWQERVRAEYAPSRAITVDATVANLIEDAFETYNKKHPGKFVAFSELQRANNWTRKYGATVNRVKRALIDDGVLEMEGTYNDKTQQMEYGRFPRLRIAQRKPALAEVKKA